MGWKRDIAAAGVTVLVLGAGYFTVRSLTPAPLVSAEATTPDLETSWNETISKLGIDPVYPPEEDIMVGDLLAVVVADDPDPNATKNTKLDSKSPFLRRTVKIAHIDLREQLTAVYSEITEFPTAAAPQSSTSPRRFTQEMLHGELPYAAFPNLKIQGHNSATAGVSAGGRGSASFGADNQGIEELQLTDVRTYGLPAARASEALSAYCAAEKTKNDCLDVNARKQLEPYVGTRINTQYMDANGTEQFGVKIEIALINRVYLTGSILHLLRVGTAQGGTLRAEQRAAKPPEAEAGAQAAHSSADDATSDIKKRLDDVEAQLSKLSPGGALTFESESGSEILLKETFDRPVAFGIRTVRLERSSSAATDGLTGR
jgi:hypothetical protein